MHLKFGGMVIHDFKAFRGTHRLNLDSPGVTYVAGENRTTPRLKGNGAAKSTIWDALVWCLFGRTPRGLRNPDVKPWRMKGAKTSVTVAVQVDNAKHVIQRTANPNRFKIDGDDASDVAALLGLGFELFINTIVLPQGRELFFDRTPTEKMELLSTAINLDRWDVRVKRASDRAREAEKAVSDLENEATGFEGALTELEDQLAAAQEKSSQWALEARQRARVSKAETDLLAQEIETKERELGDAVLKEDGSLTELRYTEGKLRTDRGMLATLQRKLSSIDAEAKVTLDALIAIENDLQDLVKAKECPTCGQPVKPTNLAQHKKHLKERYQECKNTADRLANENADFAGQVITAEAAIKRLDAQADEFQANADNAHDVIVRLRPEVAELKVRLQNARSAREEANPHIQQMSELNARKTSLKTDLAAVQADLNKAQRKAARRAFWVKGFKDIKLQLIDDVLQELELATNSMIEEVGLEDWQVRFDVEKESKSGTVQRMLHVQINSPESEGPVKWEAYSGGEGQRLRLIGALALADVLLAHAGVTTNLEVLDEPAVYWSSEGVQELCEFLTTRSDDQDKSIWYIEHNTVDSMHFDGMITVVKDKNGARIEVDR